MRRTHDGAGLALPAQRRVTNLASSSDRALLRLSHRLHGGVAGRLGETLIHNGEALSKSADDAIRIKKSQKKANEEKGRSPLS